jgi:hypothetical protein
VRQELATVAQALAQQLQANECFMLVVVAVGLIAVAR